MSEVYVSEKQVKEALGITKFSEISKDKIMEFVSLIPHMDKELAMSIINQFPVYAETASKMVESLTTTCEKAIESSSSSQEDAVKGYMKVLDELSEALKKDGITEEERKDITSKMVEVADKISGIDDKNKEFLMSVIKYKGYIITGAMVLGAAILGVNINGGKIPFVKK